MNSLKRSLFWVAFYMAAIFVMAQFDYEDSPIIDFAKYFYFLVLLGVPATVFFPGVSKVSPAIPLVLWGCVYLVTLETVDRTASAPHTTFPIILLELILLEIGIWLGYYLAHGIGEAESIMDAMALSAFPNRTQNLEQAEQQIRVEINRSRRYHRPLTLFLLYPDPDNQIPVKEMLQAIRHDIWSRFSLARIGQVIDEHVRQTDIVMRDRGSRFVVLCPETDLASAEVMAYRISEAVELKTGTHIFWGVASFPDDALNFDDLMDVALNKLSQTQTSSGKLKRGMTAAKKPGRKTRSA